LTAMQLSQIAFYSDSGTTFLGTAGYASGMDGEIVPVSEPSTWFAAALAFAGLGFMQRRRMQKFLASFNARSATRAPLAPGENVAELTNVSNRAVIVNP
jgi:MYXO-CTERM domain-containing protein